MSNDHRGESPTTDPADGNPMARLDETPPGDQSPPEIEEGARQRLENDGCPITG